MTDAKVPFPTLLSAEGDPGAEFAVLSPDFASEALSAYAIRHGLRPSAERPPVGVYVTELWRRRHFVMAFATARNIAMYTEAKLGQIWQVLTPLLNAGVYFLIFGLLLDINRGIPNYLAFLVTGVFVFNFTQRAFITTSSVITESLPLIRALQFPRAALPLAYVMVELEQMALAMAVLVVIVLASGEPITWYWLLVIPALLLQTVFNIGIGLFAARLGSQVNDFSQLLPFLMRTWLYLSGVLFSIQNLTLSKSSHVPAWAVPVLASNPAAVYINLVRNSIMASQRLSAPGSQPYNAARCGLWQHAVQSSSVVPPNLEYDSAYCHAAVAVSHFWYYGIGWAALALVVGFFFFWRAETRYGRG
ncbi:MAG TPA: ABC transporter permease [Streptosporangiaceae bacterium]|nr:ABC transporter permease [Streptosporangiaceae bacterium]